mgnify:CR=1 FL=1
MSWKECTVDRSKKCAREEDKGHSECKEKRDYGYNKCTEERDNGYRDCCTWWPCSWACKAWVWVSHIVCVVWTWVSNIVCVVWTWIKHIVCVLWVYSSAVICIIPGIGKHITDFLDGALAIALGAIGSIIGGIVDFVTHPIESIKTIISLFTGCPSVRAAEMFPLQIIAHHGAAFELPENTIQSCRRAIALGATALEVDICMTSDEHLVLWHDWDPDSLISVARQTEVGGSDNAFSPDVPKVGSDWRKPTIDLTLDQFRQHFTYSDERDPVVRIKYEVEHGKIDLTIPTLDEFFKAAVTWEALRVVYLDIKMPATSALRYAGLMADKIHRLISNDKLKVDFKVVVMVPDSLVLQVMKARAQENDYNLVFTWDVEFPPGVVLNPIMYSAIDHATSSLFHNDVASVGRPVATLFPWKVYRRTIEHDIRQWNKVNSDPARFNAGVKIESLVAWTINETDEMKCLAQMGVSGIITDKIKDLVDVAREVGRTAPASTGGRSHIG